MPCQMWVAVVLVASDNRVHSFAAGTSITFERSEVCARNGPKRDTAPQRARAKLITPLGFEISFAACVNEIDSLH